MPSWPPIARSTMSRLVASASAAKTRSASGTAVIIDTTIRLYLRPCQPLIVARGSRSGSFGGAADAQAGRVRRAGLVALGVAPGPVVEVREVGPCSQHADVGVVA